MVDFPPACRPADQKDIFFMRALCALVVDVILPHAKQLARESHYQGVETAFLPSAKNLNPWEVGTTRVATPLFGRLVLPLFSSDRSLLLSFGVGWGWTRARRGVGRVGMGWLVSHSLRL